MHVALVNGFTELTPLADVAGVTVRRMTNGAPAEILGRLGITTNLPVGEASKGVRGPSGRRRLQTEWFSSICTECIRQGRVRVPSTWALPVEMMCTVHECVLLSACPRCSLKIDLARGDWRSCACGYDFGTVPAVPAPRWMMRMGHVLRRALKNPGRRQTFTASSKREAQVLDCVEALRDLAGAKSLQELFSSFGDAAQEETIRQSLAGKKHLQWRLSQCGMGISPQIARLLFNAADLSGTHVRGAIQRARYLCRRRGEALTVGRVWRFAVHHMLYECHCVSVSQQADWRCGWDDAGSDDCSK